MCIYCNTNNYHKIYENLIGTIPIEEDGRTHENHHIDGDHSNNYPKDLTAITILSKLIITGELYTFHEEKDLSQQPKMKLCIKKL